MPQYSITTWSEDKLVRNEHMDAASPEQAIAFAQGILTERTREHGEMLVKLGVRYVLEECHRAADDLAIAIPEDRVGTWHLWHDGVATTLMLDSTEPSWKAIGSEITAL